MITYREIAEFMLHLIQDEGVTDAQSHIGTFTAYDGIDSLPTYFGAKIDKVWGKIEPDTRCLYVYITEDTYLDAVMAYFSLLEDGVFLTCTFGDTAERIVVLPIAPEICITYKK